MTGIWSKRRVVRVAEVGATLVVAALLTLAYAEQARAAGPFEPNDSREAAHGPLAGDKYYSAKIETVNDIDWYYFYVKSYGQFDFTSTMTASDSCRADFALFDKDGNNTQPASYFHATHKNQLEHFNITLEPGRYYLEVEDCEGETYKFKISPASSLTTSEDCGEAILAKEDAQPELDKVGDLLDKNDDALAKVDEVVAKQKAPLVGLTRHWRKLKPRWQRNARRIAKSTRPGYVKRRSWRRLRFSKRRAHRRIAAKMQAPRERLAKANETREKVLAIRSDLEALDSQYDDVVEDAEETIEDDC